MEGTDSILPDTLESLWDDELNRLFAKLNFQHQTFALAFLEHPHQGKAYEKTYGKTGPAAAASASALLKHPNMRAFITAYRNKDKHRHEDDKELIRYTYRGAILADDAGYKNKINAAAQLAKLDGHNEAEKVQDDRFTALVQLMNTRGKNGTKS